MAHGDPLAKMGNAMLARDLPRIHAETEAWAKGAAEPLREPYGVRIEPSNVVHTHSRLVELGREADLPVWDGMGHACQLDDTLPESRQGCGRSHASSASVRICRPRPPRRPDRHRRWPPPARSGTVVPRTGRLGAATPRPPRPLPLPRRSWP